MTASVAEVSFNKSGGGRAILWGGLIAGTMDITAAFINSWIHGRSPIWVLQLIASGLLGPDAYKGGLPVAALGLALHFLIAYGATVVFYLASRKMKFLVNQPFIFGPLYGIAVYLFMNLIVLNLAFPNRATPAVSAIITGVVILMFCIGLPIALVVRHYSK